MFRKQQFCDISSWWQMLKSADSAYTSCLWPFILLLLCSLTEWRPCPLSSFCRDFFSENRVRWSRRNRQELQDAAKVLRRIRRQIHRRRLTLESPMHSNLYSIWNYRIICSNNTRQCHRTKHRMSQIFKKRF